MVWTDTLVFIFVYIQPSIVGILLSFALSKGLSNTPYFNWMLGARSHSKNASFFECAASPRLLSFFSYEMPMLAFCALFILYDADFLFFVPEMLAGEFWTCSQFYVLFMCVVFFLGSLWYDLNRCGFLWEI